MYNIGSIPIVFVKARTINQIIEPFLADFHMPNNFQKVDHKITIAKIEMTALGANPKLSHTPFTK